MVFCASIPITSQSNPNPVTMLNQPPSFLPPNSIVFGYLRYSSDNQSIASQEHALREWCHAHHIVLARTFKDEAKSGASVAGRESFLQLFDTLIHGTAAARPVAVLIWSWSRFSREVKDAEYYKTRIRYETGVQVWSLTDYIPEGKFAGVFEAFQHIQDADARTRLITDTTRGLHDLASQGFSSGGFPPVGYVRGESIAIGKKKNGETRYAHKWEMDPNTRARVKMAWEMRLAGRSFWEIHAATKLMANARGYTDFFKRPTYAGAIKCGSTIAWNAHPAYVTREEWERVRSMTKTRATQMQAGESHPWRRRVGSPYLLSGRLRCGYCGWAMVGSLYRGVPYYRCDWRHRQGHAHASCQQPAIVAHAVHEQVAAILANHILTYEELVAARDSINAALSGNTATLRVRYDFLLGEQKRLSLAITNLVTSLEKLGAVREVEDRLNARRRELAETRSEMIQIEKRIADGEIRVGNDVLRLLATEMQNELLRGDVKLVRDLMRATIHQSDLFMDSIHIRYSPLPVIEAASQTKRSADFSTLLNALGPIHTAPQTCNNSVPLTGYRFITGIPLSFKKFPFVRPTKGYSRKLASA